jgi:HK97 gp10 family phage protein
MLRGSSKSKGGQKRFMLDKLEMPELEALEKIARRKVMYNAAKIVALRVREIVPVGAQKHKNKLSKSIRYRAFADGLKSQVASKAPHAHLVHDGTKAHDIRAHSHETARSGWMFYHGSERSTVHHPGAQGFPFLIEARDQTIHEVEEGMRRDMEEALAEIAAGGTG